MENWGCDFLVRIPLVARPGEQLIIPGLDAAAAAAAAAAAVAAAAAAVSEQLFLVVAHFDWYPRFYPLTSFCTRSTTTCQLSYHLRALASCHIMLHDRRRCSLNKTR